MSPSAAADDWPATQTYLRALADLRRECSREADRAQVGEAPGPALRGLLVEVLTLYSERSAPRCPFCQAERNTLIHILGCEASHDEL
ncbi:MAG: hypothetical protein NVS3B1_05950 [Marmoricola sp.]